MMYIGCSGWSYPDWVGSFYPSASSDKLKYYTRKFNTVEINTTFYRIPPLEVFGKWLKKSGGREFRFSVKFPSEVTHAKLLKDVEGAISVAQDFESRHIAMAKDAEKLLAVLIQLPPYFSEHDSERLFYLMDSLSTREIRYFVEVRNPTLYGNSEFAGKLRRTGAEIVDIDGPEKTLDGINSMGDSFYVRFHGRNYSMWGNKNTNSSARYDYHYSEFEIRSFSDIIRERLGKYKDALIYFNNHPSGQAPDNALSLSEHLGEYHGEKQAKLF